MHFLTKTMQGDRQSTISLALDDMPWFHGRLSHKNAEKLLEPKECGLFLIRERVGFPGDYVLSLCPDTTTVMNYLIIKKINLFTLDDEIFFKDLFQLVKHYEKDAGILCSTLTIPLDKNDRSVYRRSSINEKSDSKERKFVAGSQANSVVTEEGLNIVVVLGSIADQQVDVIVNSVGDRFCLNAGALSKTFLQGAGPGIQDELTEMVPGNYKCGDVVVTKGYNLNCYCVFHGSLVRYESNNGEKAQQVMQTFLRNVLNEANNLKFSSVAIPVIGSGGLGFPAKVVVELLFSEADNFSASDSDATVNEIRFINYPQDVETFKVFKEQISLMISNSEREMKRKTFGGVSQGLTDLDVQPPRSKSRNLSITPMFKKMGLGCPKKWDLLPDDSEKLFKREELQTFDTEFIYVSQQMRATATKGAACRKIVKIERIQNKHLYLMYVVHKSAMEKKNGPSSENERLLWHGTAADSIGNICFGGFNRGYSGKNAVLFGQGVYFANEFEYSAKPLYSPPDANGIKYVFLCQVLTGTFTVGRPEMIEPEIKTDQIRHDSAVNKLDNPSVFVVFKDAQAYPMYLVSFT